MKNSSPFDPKLAVKYGLFVEAAYRMQTAAPNSTNPPPVAIPSGYKFLASIQNARLRVCKRSLDFLRVYYAKHSEPARIRPGDLLVAGFAIFGEGRTTRGARLRRKSMSMM